MSAYLKLFQRALDAATNEPQCRRCLCYGDENHHLVKVWDTYMRECEKCGNLCDGEFDDDPAP